MGSLQWNANYTWSRTTIYDRGNTTAAYCVQWIDDKLIKNVVNRPHAVNFNYSYDLPRASRLWNNAFAKVALDGWKINGNGAIYSGTPFTVTCAAQSAPAGYWTGTRQEAYRSAARWGTKSFRPAVSFHPGRKTRACSGD